MTLFMSSLTLDDLPSVRMLQLRNQQIILKDGIANQQITFSEDNIGQSWITGLEAYHYELQLDEDSEEGSIKPINGLITALDE